MTTPASLSPSLSQVFHRLVVDIVSGRFPPGSRLPPERELTQTHGASRPTLREALRRLTEWRLVTARRGSGIVVRPVRDWSLEVLPAYLKHGASRRGPTELAGLIIDLLTVRRELVVQVLRIVAPRITPGSLTAAREAAERAWSARHDQAAFVREDFEIIRTLVEAANFLPALWVLGDMAHVYLEIAGAMTGTQTPPEDYLGTHAEVISFLERGDADSACRRMAEYLDAHDRRLLHQMGIRQ